jgi:hypothetical protein
MKGKKSDKARLLAALRYEGNRGITTLDFEPPHVWDEGDPIKQIARRIYDLRQDGHDIVTDGKRQGVAIYKLRESPAVPAGPVAALADYQEGGGLFDPPAAPPTRPSAYFGEDAA